MEKNNKINKTNELQKLMKKKKQEVRCSNCTATIITDDLSNWNKYNGFCKKCIDKTKEKIRAEVKKEIEKELLLVKEKKEKELKKLKTIEKKQKKSRTITKKIIITESEFKSLKRGSVAVYDRVLDGYHINLVYNEDLFGMGSDTLPSEIKEKCIRCDGRGYVNKNISTGEIR